jgi:methylglyoxal/glyoxal reductase
MTYHLHNGIEMPLLGLGCWAMWNEEAQKTVENALEIGYRLIDTASMYQNEAAVGAGIAVSGISRKDIFVTTKVANDDQGYDSTLRAYENSCHLMGLDYVDLYLMHWPIKGKRQETWRAMERLYEEGAVRAIGVCNYALPFLQEMEGYAHIVPMVNQCELSPYLYQKDLVEACIAKNILMQAWSPIVRGKRFDDPKLLEIARKYDKSPAQILIRWGLDHKFSSIPKSASKERLLENLQVLNFSISADDIALMDGFDEGFRVSGEDPMSMF